MTVKTLTMEVEKLNSKMETLEKYLQEKIKDLEEKHDYECKEKHNKENKNFQIKISDMGTIIKDLEEKLNCVSKVKQLNIVDIE